MKSKTRITLSVFLSAAAIVCAVSAAAFAGSPMADGSESVQNIAHGTRYEESERAEFILREKEGYIAIFTENDEKTPAAVTDIEVKLLPDADREMLSKGIPAYSREELMALLEDMGS